MHKLNRNFILSFKEKSIQSEEGMKNCHHDLINISLKKLVCKMPIIFSNIKAMPRFNSESVYNYLSCHQLKSFFKKLKKNTSFIF